MITVLNNSINSSMLDRDAIEFIRVAQITDSTQITAINELCKDLKREKIWNRLWYAFPFVYNGTTSSMLVELKTRDSAIISTQSNSPNIDPIFSSTGIKFRGGNSLIFRRGQNWSLSNNSETNSVNDANPAHISFYSRTATFSEGEKFGGIFFYNWPTIPNRFSLYSTYSEASNAVFKFSLSDTRDRFGYVEFSATVSSFQGLFLVSNSDNNGGLSASTSNPYKRYFSQNGNILATASSTQAKSLSSKGAPIVLSNSDSTTNPVNPSLWQLLGTSPTAASGNTEFCWWSLGGSNFNNNQGDFIPESQQSTYYQIIQKFQTNLGRQV